MKDYSVLSGMIYNHTSEMRTAYDKGYKQGDQDCNERYASAIAQLEKAKAEAYENGMELAWECAKRIIALSPDMQEDIFNMRGDHIILDAYSASEAIDIMDRHDVKEEVSDYCKIEVGDEIISGDAHVVVTWLDKYGNWNGMLLNECEEGYIGSTYSCMNGFRGWRKTNKRYPKIAEALGKKDDTDA